MDSANFAGWLAGRFQPGSCLVDAVTGQVFERLERQVCAAARGYQGLEPGSRVLVICRQDPQTALALLGALYAGLVVVPADGRDPAAIARLLRATRAEALWSGNAEDAGLAGEAAFRSGLPDPAGEAGEPFPAMARGAGDLAALMPTSGTTQAPRLVRVSHGNLIANTLAILQSQELSARDRAMLILPLSYCFGASVLYSHLAAGGSVVFDRRFMFPDKVLHAMAAHGCTTLAGVPSVFTLLLSRSRLGSIELPAWRRALQAGGRLAPEQVAAFRERMPGVGFHVMYGQTEATSRIASLPPGELEARRGSVGLPLANLRLRIVDDQRRELPPRAVGSIEVAGPSVCHGYWNDEPASRARFPDEWLLTGDRGWQDEDGFLWIEGRNEDFLKIRGRRVSFVEIEGLVLQVPGVEQAAVLSVPDAEAGEAPAVFVVPQVGGAGTDLPGRVLKALPPAWTCRRVVELPGLPLTPRGKLDRAALRQLLA